MKTIKCHVECKGKDYSNEQQEIGIEQTDLEFRLGIVFLDKLNGIYEHNSGGTMIEFINNETWLLSESIGEVEKLIEKANEFQLTSSN